MPKRTKKRGKKKLKAVAYEFIKPDTTVGEPMYALLQQLIAAHHDDIPGVRIALAWNTAWKRDVDGRVTLGKCRKVSDLEREVADVVAYDFVIILSKDFWHNPLTSDLQRRALLDHELCHAAIAHDEYGEPLEDERGRLVYRIRKHDVEEFAVIGERYGCYKADLEVFAESLHRAHHKAGSCWTAFTSIQEQLLRAGVNVELETVVSWELRQRREAIAYALLLLELRQLAEAGKAPRRAAPAMPAFLREPALVPSEAPRQDTLPPVPPADFTEAPSTTEVKH